MKAFTILFLTLAVSSISASSFLIVKFDEAKLRNNKFYQCVKKLGQPNSRNYVNYMKSAGRCVNQNRASCKDSCNYIKYGDARRCQALCQSTGANIRRAFERLGGIRNNLLNRFGRY